jgi:hypothetical protein
MPEDDVRDYHNALRDMCINNRFIQLDALKYDLDNIARHYAALSEEEKKSLDNMLGLTPKPLFYDSQDIGNKRKHGMELTLENLKYYIQHAGNYHYSHLEALEIFHAMKELGDTPLGIVQSGKKAGMIVTLEDCFSDKCYYPLASVDFEKLAKCDFQKYAALRQAWLSARKCMDRNLSEGIKYSDTERVYYNRRYQTLEDFYVNVACKKSLLAVTPDDGVVVSSVKTIQKNLDTDLDTALVIWEQLLAYTSNLQDKSSKDKLSRWEIRDIIIHNSDTATPELWSYAGWTHENAEELAEVYRLPESSVPGLSSMLELIEQQKEHDRGEEWSSYKEMSAEERWSHEAQYEFAEIVIQDALADAERARGRKLQKNVSDLDSIRSSYAWGYCDASFVWQSAYDAAMEQITKEQASKIDQGKAELERFDHVTLCHYNALENPETSAKEYRADELLRLVKMAGDWSDIILEESEDSFDCYDVMYSLALSLGLLESDYEEPQELLESLDYNLSLNGYLSQPGHNEKALQVIHFDEMNEPTKLHSKDLYTAQELFKLIDQARDWYENVAENTFTAWDALCSLAYWKGLSPKMCDSAEELQDYLESAYMAELQADQDKESD